MASMVYVTAKEMDEAERIAEHLLEKRIIACANIFPIWSIYSWKGKVEKENEVALMLKTSHDLVDRVIKEVRKVHSYEVPCIVSYRIDKGDKDYLEWIRNETDIVSGLNV